MSGPAVLLRLNAPDGSLTVATTPDSSSTRLVVEVRHLDTGARAELTVDEVKALRETLFEWLVEGEHIDNPIAQGTDDE